MCIYPQERRREFEANLLKAGLELEKDDKSVSSDSAQQQHLVDNLQRHSTFKRAES